MTLTKEDKTRLREMEAWVNRHSQIMDDLHKANPDLPFVTLAVMASDQQSAEKADELLAAGEPFDAVRHIVGSYSRLTWTVGKYSEGLISHAELLDEWPELWRGSDPDDTDRRWLQIWREAYQRAGRTVLDEGVPLPPGRLTLFRGQMAGDPLGIAWSLDRGIAAKFANGAGFRTAVMGGIIIVARVRRDRVLGYLTGRGESEVIVDPGDVRVMRTEAP